MIELCIRCEHPSHFGRCVECGCERIAIREHGSSSTKPTLQDSYNTEIEIHNKTLDELARVRGLLQRATESFEEIAGCNGNTTLSMPCDDCRAVANEWLVEAGDAESADIGKLDAADKKHVCGQMGFNPSIGDTCAGCETRKAGADMEWRWGK